MYCAGGIQHLSNYFHICAHSRADRNTIYCSTRCPIIARAIIAIVACVDMVAFIAAVTKLNFAHIFTELLARTLDSLNGSINIRTIGFEARQDQVYLVTCLYSGYQRDIEFH